MLAIGTDSLTHQVTVGDHIALVGQQRMPEGNLGIQLNIGDFAAADAADMMVVRQSGIVAIRPLGHLHQAELSLFGKLTQYAVNGGLAGGGVLLLQERINLFRRGMILHLTNRVQNLLLLRGIAALHRITSC